MRYTFASAAILAFTTSVFAQTPGFDAITSPAQDQVATVGQTLDIVWQPNGVTGTVTIQLLEGGSPSTLNYDPVLVASSIDNLSGKFSWTIPASVGNFKTYGFQITLDSDSSTFQWSNHFIINQAATTTSSSSIAAPTTSSSSSAVVFTPTYATTETAPTTLSSVVAPSSVVVPTTAVIPPITTGTPSVGNGTSNGTYTTPGAGSTGTATGSGPAIATANAAAGVVATGGLAILGSIFAFVL